MRAYDLARLSLTIVANDESLSLPFIRKKGEGLTLGFYTFEEKLFEKEGRLLLERELGWVNQVWAIDPVLTSVEKLPVPKIQSLPRGYNPLGDCKAEEYEEVYFQYCNAIDKVLEGKDGTVEYKELAKRIIPRELVEIYSACGAEFLSQTEVE